ncbi:hypothetical protein A3839_28380 [Achromobacter insolitus]|nr:hypothetical protein A3839_28380 [Achromobacter insolitus]
MDKVQTTEMNTQWHTFEERKGQVVQNGKSAYPDALRLYIKRADALTFAMNILRQLEQPRPDAGPVIEIALFGQLERDADDDE